MRPRGVSLVETILAMVLVVMVLLVAVNLFPQALWSTRMREHQLLAAELACSTLRDVASRPTLAPGETTPPEAKLDHVTFTRKVNVTAVPGVDPTVYLNVRVEVKWQSLTKQEQSLVRELGVCRLPAP